MNIVDLIYPKICVGCRREGEYICVDCRRKLVKPIQICPMCCRESIDGWTHPRCKKDYDIEKLMIGLPYKGVVQDCMKKIKYRSCWDIIKFVFDLCDFPLITDCMVVSVPMWRDKKKERGFNQAEILGKLVAERNESQYLEALLRIRQTKPMYGLNIEDRKRNVISAFKVSDININELVGKRVVLVDDVWTTGATMRECASVLKKAGVSEIFGLTLAW